MTPLTHIGGYDVHLLIQGFPGKSNENGGLGWSSVVLLRGHGRNILVDTGSFSVRRVLTDKLKSFGIARGDVTDLLLTHAHYDHMMNWTLFPNARIALSSAELDWALADDIEGSLCAELYVRELSRSEQLSRISVGDTGLPGVVSYETPGHTPHHLVFVIDDGERRIILAADAVKNRAEFVSENAVSTLDPTASNESIRAVKKLWLERDDAMLICGHDLPIINDKGEARYIGDRQAGITAWLDVDLSKPTKFALKD